MKSNYKKIIMLLFWVVSFVILFFPNNVYGLSVGYTIKSYNVDVNVNENNSFDIIETITVNFEEEKHGIIRKIPTSNKVVRNDGSSITNYAFISGIEISDPYTKSSSSGYISLKIGSEYKTLLGEHTYTIKYRYYIIGKDGLKNADEFYFNLIGTQWDTGIENATFKVTMPKAFDESLLGFSSGYKDSKESSNVQYSVDGNVIKGRIKKSLKANQGITIRLTLPDEYFFNIIDLFEKQYMNIIISIAAFFLLRAFILWFKYGKDEMVVETVEFYPPKGYNSAEIGYIYNGKATDEAIISILIELANKGYIKIEEIEKDGVLRKKTFKIIKLKEHYGNDYIERIFFDGLFEKGNPNPDELDLYIKEAERKGEKITKHKIKMFKRRLPIKEVTEKELKNKFYTTINRIKKQLDYKKDKIYEENDSRKQKIKSMISKICFLALCNICIQSDVNISYKILTIVVLQFSISKLINIMFFYRRTVVNIISFIIFTIISAYFTKKYIYSIVIQNIEVRNFYIIIVSIIVILSILANLMSKRTNHGNTILGKIKGFRRFLENAEKEQLEMLVEEQPEYFFNILPYTYALGVSKKWIKQFETIAISPPEWYDSSNKKFNTIDFTRSLDNVVKDIYDSMTYGIKEYNEPKKESNSWWSLSSSNDSYSYSSSSDNSSSSSGGGSTGRGSGGRWRKFVVIKKFYKRILNFERLIIYR